MYELASKHFLGFPYNFQMEFSILVHCERSRRSSEVTEETSSRCRRQKSRATFCKHAPTLLITKTAILGGIQQLRGHNFAIFWPPTPWVDSFLYPERGEKQTFFDPLPLHLVHVVIECPLNQKPQEQKWTSYHYMCLIKGQF